MKTKITIATLIATIWLSCNDRNIDLKVQSSQARIVSFSTTEEFKSTTDQIIKMTDAELDVWEKGKSFKSYRTVLKEATIEWETINNETGVANFLKKYDDILTLRDDVLSPYITVPLYQAISNQDGIYGTGRYLNKLIGNRIVSVKQENSNLLSSINSVNDISNPAIVKDFEIFSITYTTGQLYNPKSEKGKNAQRVSAICGVIETKQEYHDPSRCNSDRRCDVRAESYVDYYTDGLGAFFWRPAATTSISAFRKNVFCNWSSYNTVMDRANSSFRIRDSSFNIVLTSIPNASSGSASNLSWSGAVGSYAWTLFGPPSPSNFYSVHIEGKTQGVPTWAILDCAQ